MDNERNEVIEKTPKQKKSVDKKKRSGVIVFCIGLAALVGGVAFLLYNMFKAPDIRDAEYLVQVGTWQREDEPTVVWQFTEVGKGTLTTNFHINEYDFIWALDGDNLKIETDWLYTLNDEYVYSLNQSNNTLTLINGNETWVFVPVQVLPDEETN